MAMLENRAQQNKFVCVGLDSEYEKIPAHVREKYGQDAVRQFNREVIEATHDIVCAYKLNSAFYEAQGGSGIATLRRSIEDIFSVTDDVPVIDDAKRADIGNTNAGYVKAVFGDLRADAITVHPYLGAEALAPFLEQKDKGIFVLCRTSNPGAGEFQDLNVEGGDPLYRHVAWHVASKKWNQNGNCGLVVGATYPQELKEIRQFVGDMPILIPGIGAQGGDVEKTVAAGKNQHGRGMIINSSRGIIFASNGKDFAEAARRETQRLHDVIISYL